jgi:uncharacterized protein YndB with AHSA1/START domain
MAAAAMEMGVRDWWATGRSRSHASLTHRGIWSLEQWIDPKAIGEWWGPRGFTTTTHSMEVHEGGLWQYTMHGPDGTNYPNEVRYEEVEIPERILYSVTGGTEDDGTHTHRVIVEFRDKGGGTEISMRMIFPSATERDHVVNVYGAVQGLNETTDRLRCAM